MSQRGSGYERKALDLYDTPAWVTAALLPHLPGVRAVWEPAAGSGKMVEGKSFPPAISDASTVRPPPRCHGVGTQIARA